MATSTSTSGISPDLVYSHQFERFSGICALCAAITGLLYATSFFILHNAALTATLLMLAGLLTLPVVTAVYKRVVENDASFALLSFLLVAVGALGTLVHGAFDLANTLHPVALSPAFADLPNPIDPRGVLTFGVAGLGVAMLSWLIGRQSGSQSFSRGLSYLGYLAALLLLTIYLGRLIILTPTNPIIAVAALLSGFLVNPLWYVWLGVMLLRGSRLQA